MRFMKFSFLACSLFFGSILFGQIITPAYVISNGSNGIKSVSEEERTEFRDFRLSKNTRYNKQGFPVWVTEFTINHEMISTRYDYMINEDDSIITVTKSTQLLSVEKPEDEVKEIYNYQFSNGSLWESKPVEGNETVTDYKQFQYDENWNLIAMNEVKVIGADTNVVKRHRYSVQTDVFHRLISTSYSDVGTRTDYYYGSEGMLLSTAIIDGSSKRTTTHRVYNEDGLVELTMEVINRGGNLMGIKRYNYRTYGKGKTSIFEKWMPVQHAESVMQER